MLRTVYPYVMVMSQDCDLEFDRSARHALAEAGPQPLRGPERKDWDEADRRAHSKLFESVLVCVAEEESKVHDASGLRTKQWQFAESNQHGPYHFLRAGLSDVNAEGLGFPQLVLDFKRYFTLAPDELIGRIELTGHATGRARRRSVLVSPYLEDVASRFYAFQARIALPDERRPD